MSGKIIRSRGTRRILSMFLALSMLISALPSFAIAGNASDDFPLPQATRSMYYDLRKAYTEGTDTEFMKTVSYEMTTAGSEQEKNPDITSDPWAFYSTTATGGNSYFRYVGTNYGIAMYHKNTGRLKIKVLEDGMYYPVAKMNENTNVPVSISLYEYDAETDTVGAVLASKVITVSGETANFALTDEAIALSAGEYILEVKNSTQDGKLAVFEAFALNIDAYDLTYDFLKAYNGEHTTEYTQTITYEMTSGESALNPSIESDPWAFYAYVPNGTPDANYYFRYNGNAYGLALSRPGVGSVKIKVPVTGKYRPFANMHSATTAGTKVGLYRMDGDSQGELIVEKTLTVSDTQDYALSDDAIELDAGEYIVSVTTSGSKCLGIINAFKLIAVNEAEIQVAMPEAEGLVTIANGGQATIPVSISLSDDSLVNYTALTVDTAFETEGVATVAVDKTVAGVNLVIDAVAEGLSTLTVTVSGDGMVTGSAKVNVKVLAEGTSAVEPRDLNYDFMKGYTGDTSNSWVPSIGYSFTTKDSVEEINPDIVTDPWAFYDTNVTGGNNYFKYNGKDYALALNDVGYGSIKIKVPATGQYLPQLTVFKNYLVTDTLVSLHRLNGSELGEVVAQKAISLAGTTTQAYDIADSAIVLEAGEYVLRVENPVPGLTIFNSFALKFMGTVASLQVTADSETTVEVGKQAELPLTVTKSDNSPVDFEALQIHVTFSTADIASAVAQTSATDAKVVFTGLKKGRTTATIHVQSGAFSAQTEVDLTVMEEQATTAGKLYYNLKKAYNNDTSTGYTSTITYDMTDGIDELNPTIESDAWAYQNWTENTSGSGAYWKYNGASYGLASYAGKNSAAPNSGSIKVKVPVSGTYIPQVELYGMSGAELVENSNSAIGTFSFAKYDAENDTVGEVLASREINSALYRPGHMVPIGTQALELEAGEYVFTMSNNIGLLIVDAYALALADTPTASELVVDDNAGLVTVKAGETVSVPVQVSMSDGSMADLSALTATATYSIEHIAAVSYADGQLKVNGTKEGKTTATVKIGEAMARFNINVLAADAEDEAARTYTYDFKKSFQTRMTKFSTITYAANTPGAYGELTTSLTSDPWAFAEMDTPGYFQYNYPAFGLILYHAGYGMVKIRVPQSGTYLPKITLGTNTSGSVRIALLSSDKTELASKTFEEGTNGLLAIADAGIALEAGEYFVKITEETEKKLAYAENFVLEYTAPVKDLQVTADSTKTVAVGSDIDLPLTLSMTDGSAIDYSTVAASVSFDPENVASAITAIADNSAKIVFTGLAAGTTQATIQVQCGEYTKSVTVSVKVIQNTEPGAQESLYYNLKKAYTAEAKGDYNYVDTITYEMTSGENALNPDIESDAWAFQSRSSQTAATINDYFRYNDSGYGLAINGSSTSELSPVYEGNLKIKVPTAGKYLPQVNIFGLASGSIGTFSISRYDPLTDEIGEVLASREINTAMYTPNSVISLSDEAIDLSAGEYVFTMKTNAKLIIVDGIGLVAADAPTASRIVLNNDEGIIKVKAGATAEIPVSVTMSDGSAADIADLIAETTFSTADIASASTGDGIIRFTGLKEGTTTATVQIGSAMARINVVVLSADAEEEQARDYTYNFKKPYIKPRNTYTYPLTLTYAANTAGAYGEINPTIASDPWAFESQAIDPNGYFKYNSDAYGLALYHPGSATLKIKVLADGEYLPKANLYSATSANTTISFLRGTEVLASKTIPAGTSGVQAIADGGIALTAGEYFVKIEHAEKSKLAIIDEFLLEDVGSASKIELSFDEVLVQVKEGEKAELPLILSMSDGSQIAYPDLSVSVAMEPENIASAQVDKQTDGVKVAFTGLAEGVTTATITVSNGTASVSKDINVSVIGAGSTVDTPHDLYYDFMKGWQGVVDYDNAKGITYAMTTRYSDQEINPDIISDPWEYYSYEPIGNADLNFYFRYNTKDYGLALSRPGIGSLKIKVPVSGTYLPQAALHSATNCPTTITLYKLEGDVLGEAVAEKEISVNGTKDYDIADAPIALEAGEYVVSMKINASKCLAIINGFRLVESSKPQIQVSADGLVTVEEGKEATLPLSLSMSDKSEVNWANLSISVDFETPGIASAIGIKNDNEAKVIFTGLSTGITKATVTVSDGASEAQVELNVSVTAQGATDTVRDLFYNIKKAWIGNTSADYPATITYSMTTKGALGEVNPDIASDPWEFLSTTSTGGNNYFKYNGKDYGLCKSQIGSGSIKIKVPVSGNYQPVAVLYKASDAAITMTLSKYDAENNAAGETLAERTQITVTDTGDYALTDDQIPLEAGEYVVTLYHSQTPGLGIIDGFKLINLDKKLAISAPELSVVKEESAKTTITVKDYEGNLIPVSDLTYQMVVADTEIATASIAEENGALVVTANGLKLGNTTAKITFSTTDGKNGEFILPITVTADFDIAVDMKIPEMVKVEEELSIPVGVRYIRNGADDGEAPAEITTAVTSPILSASVLPGVNQTGNTIQLKGVASGTVMLTITVKVSEVVKTFKYAMLVYNTTGNTTKSYRFMMQKGIPEHTELSAVNSYFKTMPGTGEQLRPNAETDTWCYAGQSEDSTFINNYDSYGSALEMDTGSWGAIKVRLPESGIYQLVSQNALYPMAGIMRVYIAPADAENPRDPKYSLGSADTFMEGTKDDIIPVHYTELRTIELEAGDYIVTWENIGRNSGCIAPAARLYIGGILFNPVEALPEITLQAGEVSDIRQYSTAEIPLTATVSDGSVEDIYGAEFDVVPSVSGIVDVKTVTKENGETALVVTGVGVGETNLAISMKVHGVVRASINVPITVTEPGKLTRVSVGVVGSELNTISLHELDPEKNQAQLEVHIFDENDVEIPAESAEIQNVSYSYASADESIASVDQTGHVVAYQAGKVTVTVTVSMSGVTKTGEAVLNVTLGKTKSSYYTEEKVANLRENAQLYPWVRTTKEAYMKAADKYVGQEEKLWNIFTTQELPRSYYVGYRGDPNAAKCRYCGCDIAAKYGSIYGWLYDAWNEPWKVQCPDCRRKFPSNDFGSFYQLGIDEHGNWSYELAKEKNAELVANGQDGYLKNVLYPEMNTEAEPNWGVDDGYGYDTGRVYADGCEEVHTYISFYNYWALYSGLIYPAITNLEQAYVYSGEAKYGRVAAIMIDRLADLYPDYDTKPYQDQLTVGKWYDPHGKFTDLIWENQYAQEWSRAYDAVFPMYEDPYVINFLSEKAEQYNMSNDKSTARLIRTNCEDGILREIFRSAKIGNIYGNFGMHQSSVTLAAVALDSMPETREMIDWVFQNGEGIGSPQANIVTGGDVLRHIINEVDRNGVSNEVSPGYSSLWSNGLSRVIDALAGYDGYPEMDLWKNPRFVQLFKYQGDIILSRRSFPAIGDTGATALNKIEISASRMIECFENTGDPYFAQMAYFLNGNKTDGLHYSEYKKNPESAKQDVQAVIDEYGEYDFDRSLQLPGYGFAALRSGSLYNLSGNQSVDTQRTFWMFYGRGAGHGHLDSLNLGIEAMGLNIAPDLGYPRDTTSDDYYNWGHATVAHNTVVVNDSSQKRIRTTGVPLHFDDSGRVKLMDADTAHQYGIENYRRTVISIDVDNEFSYGIDFFRVTGGNEHVYSFHALSDTISEMEGLGTMTPQTDASGNYVGSYAGPDVPFRTEKISSGYSYLRNVDRSGTIAGGNFMVDFKITDFRDQVENEGDMHLRMTMLNGFDLSEVAITNGDPPPRDNNPETLKYVLARRSGSNLDSLFATVFEPYEDERYIETIESVTNIVHADGSALNSDEVVRAIKVTLTNGRIDYIVYAADNSIEYRVDDLFNIRGFVGVYTVQDGENVYSYVNDGDIIGDSNGLGAVTGNVVDFTKDLVFDNSITVSLNESIDPQTLVGKYIYIDKVGTGNAAYEILGVEGSGSQVVLDLGSISLIDSMADDGSYLYNIKEGQSFRIPLSVVNDMSPVFDPIGEKQVEAKSELNFFVHATSPIDRPITYEALDLPRGANFDPQTGKFSWIPDAGQVGIHHIAIKASNEVFESTLNFTIRVYNETGGDSSGTITVTPGGDGPSGEPGDEPGEEPGGEPGEEPGGEPGETDRFRDLGGYDWARDAINQLADEGVIKGTAPDLFSPGTDITRADFTILIVRALQLEGEADENFADVLPNDYYAKEISIAKNAGIINGVGQNNFNPRGSITRQDMMVIIARALQLEGYELKEADPSVLDAFVDSASISDYAYEAVALLVTNEKVAGSNGRIAPLDNTTRAEVAVLLYRILHPQQTS